MDDELLGYSLNALDDPTRQQVDTYLQTNPEGRHRLERLEKALRPLELDRTNPDPPKDLVLKTLALIAENRCQSQTLPLARPVSPGQAMRRGWWRRPDVIAAAALLLVTLGVLIPWIVQARRAAARMECAENLKNFGRAMEDYAEKHGEFPQVSEQEPLNFAGAIIALLQDDGLLASYRTLGCPGAGQREPERLTSGEVATQHKHYRSFYDQTVRNLGGAYAFNLGYRDKGLRGLKKGDDNRALMADRPPFGGRDTPCDGNSPNHDGRGQNVLFTGGHVRFEPVRTLDGDDIYLNRDRKIGAGLDWHDTSLGSSDAVP